jgi:hypothetical protein
VKVGQLLLCLRRKQVLGTADVCSKPEQLLKGRVLVQPPRFRELLLRLARVVRDGEDLAGEAPQICAQPIEEIRLRFDELGVAGNVLFGLPLSHDSLLIHAGGDERHEQAREQAGRR